jgi:PAS domain-containing protein
MTPSDPRDMRVVFDDDWRILDINDGAAVLVGRARADCIGRSLWELRPIVAGGPLEQALLQAAASKTPFGPEILWTVEGDPFEVEIVPANGRTTFIATAVVPGTRPEVRRERRDPGVDAGDDRRLGRERRHLDRRYHLERRTTPRSRQS